MPRVDFYVLSQDAPDARLRTALRLIEKSFEQQLRTYVQTQTLADAQRLDEWLWTFNDRSFIPHEITSGAPASHPRVLVLLGETSAPADHRQLLINLGNALPAEIDTYDRIAEIVDVDPENKRLSRERFKAYRDGGCTLETHNL
jgi:DNA polymerase-3 subunit chi